MGGSLGRRRVYRFSPVVGNPYRHFQPVSGFPQPFRPEMDKPHIGGSDPVIRCVDIDKRGGSKQPGSPAVRRSVARLNFPGSVVHRDLHDNFVVVIFGLDGLNPHQMFGDLHRIERRSLAQIVRHHPEAKPVLDGRVLADPAYILGCVGG